MSNKRIAALVIGVALACVGGLVVLVAMVTFVRDRAEASRARREAEVQAALAAERDDRRADLAAAFADPEPPTPQEAAEFAPLFAQLGRALDNGDGPAVVRLCDFDRLIDEVVHLGGGRGWPGGPGAFRHAVRDQNATWLADGLVADRTARWKQIEVRRVRWTADRREAVLVTTHQDGAGEKQRFRWWVVRRGAQWRVYDNEDLLVGLRGSTVFAASMTPEMVAFIEKSPGRYAAALDAFRLADLALRERNSPEEAERALEPARGVPLPDGYQGYLALSDARIHIARNEFDAALGKLDEAARRAPGMVILRQWRAVTLNSVGRHDDALTEIRAYQKELGPDAFSCALEGAALEGQGKGAEAAEAYRRALDESADSTDALHGLRRVLPADRKGELGDRLAKARDPRKTYDELVGQARQDGDAAAVDALLDGLLKADPADPRALGDDIRRRVKAEKFAEALVLLKRGLRAKDRDDRESVLDAYLFAMLGAKKAREAYSGVPAAHAAHAFRTLADSLEDDLDDGDEDRAPEALKLLNELIAAHRAHAPGDAWLWYYEGAIHQSAKEYERAAKAFADGAAKLPPAAADPDGDAPAADRFRSRRVACLFKLKKGLDAYREVGPAADTFRQLAGLYDMDKDFDGLADLIAAHRAARDPERTYWQARLCYRKGEFTKAAPVFEKYLDEGGEKAPNQWAARDQLIRCVLRTKPANAARTVRDLGADKVSAALRAAVAAASGDRAELERLLAESATDGRRTWFYTDEDFRTVIAQERYRDLRAKYPDPNPPPRLDG